MVMPESNNSLLRTDTAAPQVSIVTPSYNQGRFIERTLRSVLDQSGVDVQYIVVDGTSRDATVDVLERYRDRLAELVIEPDDGQADALRKGFRLATADICGYLNSDDYLLPGTLRTVLEYFEQHPDVDAIYTDRIFVDQEDRLTGYWRLPPHSDYVMCRWDFIPQETCFWRRAVMEELGGIDPGYQFAVDYDLFARMMKNGKRFVHLPGFFAVFREHSESKTSSQLEAVGLQEMERVREKYGFVVKRYHMPIAAFYYGLVRARSIVYEWRNPDGPDVFRSYGNS